RYWEIGNEMNHWRAADPDAEPIEGPAAQREPLMPPDGFSPQEQGVFLAQVAAYIREHDPDAVIVMPGMGGLDDYTLHTWFAGVIEGGGTDWFDVVNYHFYSSWERFMPLRQRFTAFLDQHGLADRPVWLTETGCSAAPMLDIRTNYPNSLETQAADIFRRIIPAYGHGDALVMWHTYIGSPVNPNNMWRLYGIRQDTTQGGVAQPSYYALQLLIAELIPFAQVEAILTERDGAQVYRVVTAAGATKYVAWGAGTFTVPEGMTQAVPVVPDVGGTYSWEAVATGDVLTLTAVPVLVK
ncbi:MAG: hypothetical protein K8S97_07890, partial [Anaerolineae bacterium]|nr:hypothetical protein [Anaerolineae bacterium]